MARGRKKAEISMLDAYTNELERLTILEKQQVANLENCRAEIKKYKDLILQEQLKELKTMMDDKNVTFEELKEMLENHNNTNEVAGE